MKRTMAMLAMCAALGPSAAGAHERQDQFQRAYGFRLEIDGVDAGAFRSVDGLSIEQEIVEYRDGGDNLVRKLPGRVKYGDITLKRGFLGSSTLNDWIEPAAQGGEGSVRKNITVILLDRRNSEVHRWNLFECLPMHWSLGALSSGADEPLVEELAITCDFFVEP